MIVVITFGVASHSRVFHGLTPGSDGSTAVKTHNNHYPPGRDSFKLCRNRTRMSRPEPRSLVWCMRESRPTVSAACPLGVIRRSVTEASDVLLATFRGDGICLPVSERRA